MRNVPGKSCVFHTKSAKRGEIQMSVATEKKDGVSSHTVQKLENANKCKLAIFIFICFSFFHVANSSREATPPPCQLSLDCRSKLFWSLAFKVSHLYGIFMRSEENNCRPSSVRPRRHNKPHNCTPHSPHSPFVFSFAYV